MAVAEQPDGLGQTPTNKHGFLSGALKAAVRTKQISSNPCDGNKCAGTHLAEMVFLTQEEFALLYSWVSESWQPLVEFLVATGCRVGEAAALRPADINLA